MIAVPGGETYLWAMETVPQILERAWERAYPGREAAERNALLRELTPLPASSPLVLPERFQVTRSTTATAIIGVPNRSPPGDRSWIGPLTP